MPKKKKRKTYLEKYGICEKCRRKIRVISIDAVGKVTFQYHINKKTRKTCAGGKQKCLEVQGEEDWR